MMINQKKILQIDELINFLIVMKNVISFLEISKKHLKLNKYGNKIKKTI